MKKIKITDLLIFIVTAELVGALSALLSGDFKSFYADIIRPPLSPPTWLFPAVWTVLYALMGISAYIIWQDNGSAIRKAAALKLYFLQLAFHGALYFSVSGCLKLPLLQRSCCLCLLY